MTSRNVLFGLAATALIGAAAWFGWQWYSARPADDSPAIPDIALDNVDPGVAAAVKAAVAEVREEPRSGQAWGRLAMVLAANGFEEEASRCYPHAVRLDPRNPLWLYLHGLHLLYTTPREAVALMKQALELTALPTDRAAIHFRLGLAMVEEGNFDEAERHLNDLARIEPDSPRVHYGLGLLAIGRRDGAAARVHLSTLVDNPHCRKKACLLLGTLPDGDREAARALQARAAALPRDASWPDSLELEMRALKVERLSRIAQFRALEAQGRKQEALAFLRRFVAEAPDGEVCYLFGSALYEAAEFDEAAKILRTAIGFDKTNIKAHVYLTSALFDRAEQLWLDSGDKAAALDLYRQTVAAADGVLALQGDVGGAHLMRGQALKRLGQIEEAVQALRQALLIQPEAVESHLFLGEALAEAGQVPEAIGHLENAAKLARPEDQRPRKALEKWRKTGGQK